MHTIRHLLCPVDLSEPSAQALRYAVALGSVLGSDLTVLYVHAAGAHRPPKQSPDVTLEAFAAEVVGVSPSVPMLQRAGDPVTEILDTALAVGADIIVMGTHGRTGLQRLLLGSVTERVIRRSAVPVLAVPPGLEQERRDAVSTVLCAVDFSEPSSRAVGYAASIASAAGTRLVLAHALEWSEEMETPGSIGNQLPSAEDDAIDRLRELLTDDMRDRCDPELVVGYGTPADEVLRVVHQRHVDLVVLGIRRRNPIDLAVFGSTTQRLIRERVCAVLTVHALEAR